MPLCNLKSEELECWSFFPAVKDPHTNVQRICAFRANSQARRYARLSFPSRLSWPISRKVTLYEHVIVRRNVGKTRLTLYERWKVQRKTRLIQHSVHVWKNVCKRRLANYECILVRRNVEQTKLISFKLTKVRRNALRSHIKNVGCKCTTVGRNIANVPGYRDKLRRHWG